MHPNLRDPPLQHLSQIIQAKTVRTPSAGSKPTAPTGTPPPKSPQSKICGIPTYGTHQESFEQNRYASNLRDQLLGHLWQILRTKPLRTPSARSKPYRIYKPSNQNLRPFAPLSAAICVNPFLLPLHSPPTPLPHQTQSTPAGSQQILPLPVSRIKPFQRATSLYQASQNTITDFLLMPFTPKSFD